MSSGNKALLRSAKEKYDRADFASCVSDCQQALASGGRNAYEANLLLGKATYRAGDLALSDQAYGEATRLQPESLPAWKGMVELHSSSGDHSRLADALAQLVRLGKSETPDKRWEHHHSLASALQHSKRLPEARAHLKQSLSNSSSNDWSDVQRAHLLAQLADVLNAEGKSDAHQLEELVQLVGYCVPHFEGQYRRYIQQLSSQLHALPAGSEERGQLCEQLVQKLSQQLQGGCTVAAPLETVLQLLDEAAVIQGSGLPSPATASSSFRSSCLKLLHSFPTSQTAWPAAALLLHWRKLQGLSRPSAAADRQLVSETLQRGSLRSCACASAWFLAASLWLQGGAPAKGLTAANKGVQELTAAGHANDSLAVSFLQLLAAEACLALGTLDPAQAHAHAVASAAAGAEHKSGSWRKLIRRAQAVQARIHARRGNADGAVHLWQQLLDESSAACSTEAESSAPGGTATEHWVHGGYGEVLFCQSQYKEAEQQLHAAVTLASRGNDSATDAELACHQHHLGRVHWALKRPLSITQPQNAEQKRSDEHMTLHSGQHAQQQNGVQQAAAVKPPAKADNPFKDTLSQLFQQQQPTATAAKASPFGNARTQAADLGNANKQAAHSAKADQQAADLARSGRSVDSSSVTQNGRNAHAENNHSQDQGSQSGDVDEHVAKAAELWEASAAVTCSCQAASLAWLGVYHRDALSDAESAKLSFEQALVIDPRQHIAGEGLLSMLSPEAAHKLCVETTAREPASAWAWARLGLSHARMRNAAEAVQALQAAVRLRQDDVASWEALGDSYRHLGRYTGSLKAYERALALDPRRLHALIHSGLLHLSLASFQPAMQAFAAALEVDGSFPPALLGAANTLYSSAGQRLLLGCCGTAAQELAEAAALVRKCTAGNACLAPAWKLLGDILLQSAASGPLPEASPAGKGQSIHQHELNRWQLRISACQSGSTAYCKAVHLNPACAEAWGDAAAAKLAEATLRRAHTACKPAEAVQLRRTASRLLRGALRMQPASAQLWSALGSADPREAVREYAFCRALSLDPKNAVAWAALGREYCQAGDRSLAARCFTLARGHDPTCAAAWEGMGALAAQSHTGASERLHVCEHAVGLCGGFEALLGFAEGAVAAKRAHEARVYVAACRAAEMQPLNAAVQCAKGLVCEARGAVHSALSAFRTAHDIISHSSTQPGDSSIEGPLTHSTGPAQEASPPSDSDSDSHQSQSHTQHMPVSEVIQLNLARALHETGQHEQSARLYAQLHMTEVMHSFPEAACDYAAALESLQHWQRAERVLQGVIDDEEAPVKVCFAAIQQLCRMHARSGNPTRAAETLSALMPTLQELSPPTSAMHGLFLGLLAATANSGAPSRAAFASVSDLMHAWELTEAENGARGGPVRSAELAGMLKSLEAARELHAGHSKQAVRLSCTAVFLSPTSPELRLQAASSVHQLHAAESAHRSAVSLCASVASTRLHAVSCNGYDASRQSLQAAEQVLAARRICVSAVGHQDKAWKSQIKLAQRTRHWLHDDPRIASPQQWAQLLA